MINVAKEFGYKIASFHHAVEAYKVRDLLAENNICASMWSDWWGFKLEAFDGIQANIPLVHEAGACAIVHSDSADGIQRLNQEAAKSMRAGWEAGIKIDRVDAIRWLTINPARALGIDKMDRFAGAGQERRRRHLVRRPVQRLLACRAGLHRWRARLRSERRVPSAAPRLHTWYPADGGGPMRLTLASSLVASTLIASAALHAGAQQPPSKPAQPVATKPAPPRPPQPAASGETIAITGARIHPVSGPVIDKGTVVVSGGRIARGRVERASACRRSDDRRGRESRDARLPRFVDASRDRGGVVVRRRHRRRG